MIDVVSLPIPSSGYSTPSGYAFLISVTITLCLRQIATRLLQLLSVGGSERLSLIFKRPSSPFTSRLVAMLETRLIAN